MKHLRGNNIWCTAWVSLWDSFLWFRIIFIFVGMLHNRNFTAGCGSNDEFDCSFEIADEFDLENPIQRKFFFQCHIIVVLWRLRTHGIVLIHLLNRPDNQPNGLEFKPSLLRLEWLGASGYLVYFRRGKTAGTWSRPFNLPLIPSYVGIQGYRKRWTGFETAIT